MLVTSRPSNLNLEATSKSNQEVTSSLLLPTSSTSPPPPSPPSTTTTPPGPWRSSSPSTWVSPSAHPTWVSPCATSPSPGRTPPSPTTSSSPSSSTSEEASPPSSSLQAFSIHLHLLLRHQHQDGAVLQKGWRNSVGFTVLIIILSSPGARTGFSIL
jgi:hypothetical protein